MKNPIRLLSLVLAFGICSFCVPVMAEPAEQLLDKAGLTGGLIVHVGCGDGKLTAALGFGDAFTVLGLDTEEANERLKLFKELAATL